MNDNRPTVMDEARSRYIKLSMADPDEIHALQTALEEWLDQSPSHREAYASVEGTDRIGMRAVCSEVHGRQMAEMRRHPGENSKAPSLPWTRYGAIAAAIVVVLVLVTVYAAPSVPDENPRVASAEYEPIETLRGEIREFRLADGSVATLDTDSRIEVSMTSKARHLRLAQGRARLNVAQDKRPFLVEAGPGEVVTNRASLDVGFEPDRGVAVQLISGSARLRPAPQFASYKFPAQPLIVGKPLSLVAGKFEITPTVRNADNRDWPSGWVESKAIRLDALVALANNYADKPIKLESAQLGALEVSGRFKVSDTDGFIASICKLFNLASRTDISGIYLRKR